MSDNWFSGIVPLAREDWTIAQNILATTSAMKANGTFESMSLCWSPAELELLAMFAFDAKNQIKGLHAYIDGIEGYLGEKRPTTRKRKSRLVSGASQKGDRETK